MSTRIEKILIFDGECDFCISCATWISRRWTTEPRPRAIAWQSLAHVGPQDAMPRVEQMHQSVWWIAGNRREAGSRAIAEALIATSGPWRVVGHILVQPPVSWFAPHIYRFVAHHRHRLPGATSACRLSGDF